MNLTAKHPSDAAPASDVPEPTLSVQDLSVSVAHPDRCSAADQKYQL